MALNKPTHFPINFLVRYDKKEDSMETAEALRIRALKRLAMTHLKIEAAASTVDLYDYNNENILGSLQHHLWIVDGITYEPKIRTVTVPVKEKRAKEKIVPPTEPPRKMMKEKVDLKPRQALSFVDLPGSERVTKSGSTANQLKEVQSINKSLSALGDVIKALSSGNQHIPYRNHKLTMLMSDSLGGNAKTLMFVNISPAESNLDETYYSLTYASRVHSIVNNLARIFHQRKWHDCSGILEGTGR